MARGYVISLIMPVSGYVGFHGNCVIFGYEVGSNELLFFLWKLFDHDQCLVYVSNWPFLWEVTVSLISLWACIRSGHFFGHGWYLFMGCQHVIDCFVCTGKPS